MLEFKKFKEMIILDKTYKVNWWFIFFFFKVKKNSAFNLLEI